MRNYLVYFDRCGDDAERRYTLALDTEAEAIAYCNEQNAPRSGSLGLYRYEAYEKGVVEVEEPVRDGRPLLIFLGGRPTFVDEIGHDLQLTDAIEKAFSMGIFGNEDSTLADVRFDLVGPDWNVPASVIAKDEFNAVCEEASTLYAEGRFTEADRERVRQAWEEYQALLQIAGSYRKSIGRS